MIIIAKLPLAGSQNVAALAGGISTGFLLVFICLPIGIIILYYTIILLCNAVSEFKSVL